MESAERARLVEEHLELARQAAAVVYKRVKAYVAYDELLSYANVGLVEAAQRYEPGRGASFRTFAWYRVHGAVIDALRRNTGMPRRVWAQLVALRAAGEYLENQLERDTGAREKGAAEPDGTEALDKIKHAMSAIKATYICSMQSLEEMREARDFEPVSEASSPVDGIASRQLRERLNAAIAELPPRERKLLQKHYWEGKNLLEVGEELGLSKSWTSRLHAQLVDRLKKVFANDKPP
ncbi:MAG: sigma-70 family RNA polymerase sigma factor [Deltaproteobacteria bacterium]|nr:sigma-70 family RNA polymerase sigma factor [Deltaproteobacteria bacterium]MCW5807699.1 sigma-70 family RNA polymerase sigma factor [Deltaproteobacteria bacterium]